MLRRATPSLALLGPAVLAATVLAAPAEIPTTSAVPRLRDEDTRELVYLHPEGPVWVRLRIQVDHQSLDARWAAFVRKLFDFLDCDGDGVLSKRELERAPTAAMLTRSFQGQNFLLARQPTERVRWTDVDRDEDGKVTPGELEAYYLAARPGPFVLNPMAGYEPFPAATINKALLECFDTNKDGKLSRAELGAAHERIDQLDTDDDECLSLAELVPAFNPANAGRGRGRGQPVGRVGVPASVVAFAPVAVPDSLPQQMIAQYDMDKDGKLSRTELGMDEAAFARLDRARTGKLGLPELKEWFAAGRPDQEVQLRLGSAEGACTASAPKPRQAGVRVLPAEGDSQRLTVEAGRRRLHFHAVPLAGEQAAGLAAQRRYALQFVLAADTDRKGYLERKDVRSPQFRGYQFEELFDLIDRDGDGKLTRAELDAYLDLMGHGMGNVVVLTASARQPSWFNLLDADGDGRLSRRELRNAWKVLSATERNDGGFLTPAAPRQALSLYLSQGWQPPPVVYQNVAYPGTIRPGPRTARGPLWFRKMDRNGDGDVSPREFLGPRHVFDLLDKDKDGLISLAEAEAADQRLIPGPTKLPK